MPRKYLIVLFFLAFAPPLAGQGAAFADSYTQDGKPCPPECVSDSMEIVTWYPSPYNEYEELRLYPKRSAEESQCNSFEQLGLMYYNQDQQALKVCRQDPQDLSYSWKDVTLGGGYWQLSGNDIFNANSGKVGIGTTNPGGKFHLSGAEDESSSGFGVTGVVQRLSAVNNGVEAGWFAGVSGGLNRATFGTVSAHDLGFVVGGSTRMTIVGQGTNGGNVGIGTTTPDEKLSVTGLLRVKNAIRTAVDDDLILQSYTATNWVYLGDEKRKYDQVAIGNNGVRVMTITDGNVGIGTTNPAYKLTVNGSAYCASGAWSGSDLRWKKNIVALPDPLEKLSRLRGVEFDWKREEYKDKNFPEGRQIGIIAQELEKEFPELVSTDNAGYKSIAYDKLTAVLVEAVKKQEEKIRKQENLMQALEKELKDLKTNLKQ